MVNTKFVTSLNNEKIGMEVFDIDHLRGLHKVFLKEDIILSSEDLNLLQ